MSIVDLSHPIKPGMPTYPGLPEPKFRAVLSHDDSSRQKNYTPGTTFQIAAYDLGGNTGTYVDAPFHRHKEGADLAGVALDRLANLNGIVIDASPDGPTQPSVLSGLKFAGKAVLFRTGWSSRWAEITSVLGHFFQEKLATHLLQQVRLWSASTARI